MSSIQDVIRFARRNGGVFTTHEAMAMGMSKTTLYRRVSEGVFVRLGRGVLCLPGTATRPDVLMRAAARTLGAVISHQSAARLHELQPIPDSPPTVTVTYRGTNRFPGTIVHQATDLLESHIVEVRGLRVTSVARTICDLAKVLNPGRLARVVDHALASGLPLEDLIELHRALSRQGKKGMRVLGRLLEERIGKPAVSETELERRVYRLLVSSGLPEPVRQFRPPWLARINGRVDLAYPEHRIVIEADSRRWHTLNDAFEVDRRRDNAVALAGWTVLRVTWRMLVDEPTEVVSVVRQAIENASDATFGGV